MVHKILLDQTSLASKAIRCAVDNQHNYPMSENNFRTKFSTKLCSAGSKIVILCIDKTDDLLASSQQRKPMKPRVLLNTAMMVAVCIDDP